METTNSSVIDDIYYSFLKRRNELHRLIKKNQDELQETEALLNSLMEEDADMKYFSPRNTEDIYKEEINDAKNKIEFLNNENDYSQKEIDELSKKISELKLYKEHNSTNSNNSNLLDTLVDTQKINYKDIAVNLHDNTVKNLTQVINDLELAFLYIDKDPIHAKHKLESSVSNVKQIIDEVNSIISDLNYVSRET